MASLAVWFLIWFAETRFSASLDLVPLSKLTSCLNNIVNERNVEKVDKS